MDERAIVEERLGRASPIVDDPLDRRAAPRMQRYERARWLEGLISTTEF